MRTFPLLVGSLAVSIGSISAANNNDNDNETSTSQPTISFTLPDDAVTLKVEGRVQTDFGVATGDAPFKTNDGVDLRRAYLGVGGTIYDSIDYKAVFDFATDGGTLTDVFMRINGTVAGDFTVGHFKEPFGLEELTSNKYLTFAERSIGNTFSPSRNTGVMLSDSCADGRVNWFVGMFRDTNNFGDDPSGDNTESEYAYTARVAGTAWNENEGMDLLHLGVALSFRDADDNNESFSARPEVHFVPTVASVDFGGMADDTTLAGLECAWVDGPLSVQGEYDMASVSAQSGGTDGDFTAGYIEGSYFLTGEHRPYSKRSATFGRVKPKENYEPGKGGGAWMVAARYSMLDLNDGPGAAELSDITLGLTRILNPYTRIVFNVVQSTLSMTGVSDADATLAVLRFQFDF